MGGHLGEALELSIHFLAHVVGQVDVAQLLAQFGDVFVVALLAERLLDDALLVAQHVFALALLDFLPSLRLQVALHLDHGNLLPHQAVDGFQERLDLIDLQHLLLLGLLDIAQQFGQTVHLRNLVLDAADHLMEELIRVLRHDLRDALGDVEVLAHQRCRLGAIFPPRLATRALEVRPPLPRRIALRLPSSSVL